jgi:lipopolysaccharide assembly protein A
MKSIANLIACLTLAVWAIAIAIFSVQNATPVSLKLLGFESIQMPVGVVLAFSGGMGVVLGAIALLLFTRSSRQLEDAE